MSLPFDEYSLKARIWPAFIVCSPILIFCPLAISRFLNVTQVAILGMALIALMSEIVRHCGIRAEKGLLNEWGGMPSTKILRWSDQQLSKEYKHKIHQLVKKKLGTSLSSEQEEEIDPKDSDKKITEAFLTLRNRLRDAKKGSVFQDNINYGFSRNLFGSRWIWFSCSFFSVIFLILTKESSILALVLAGFYMLVIALVGWWMMKKHVEHCAMRYVESTWNQLHAL